MEKEKNIVLLAKNGLELDFDVSGDANEVYETTMNIALDGTLDEGAISEYINERVTEGENIKKLYQEILDGFVNYAWKCYDSNKISRISDTKELFFTVASDDFYPYTKLSSADKAIADCINSLIENFLTSELVQGYVENCTSYPANSLMRGVCKDIVESFTDYARNSLSVMKCETLCERISAELRKDVQKNKGKQERND